MPTQPVSNEEISAAMVTISKGQAAEVEAAMGGISAKVAAMGGSSAINGNSGLESLYASYHAWRIRNGLVSPDLPPSASYPPSARQASGTTIIG
jgi:hypothetical protein